MSAQAEPAKFSPPKSTKLSIPAPKNEMRKFGLKPLGGARGQSVPSLPSTGDSEALQALELPRPAFAQSFWKTLIIFLEKQGFFQHEYPLLLPQVPQTQVLRSPHTP